MNQSENTDKKKVMLSGLQPSGRYHIGNYFGAVKQFVDLQQDYETWISVVNYHAYTTVQDGEKMRQGTLDAVIDHIAMGLDPEASDTTLFVQSDVPEVTELTWMFDCLMTVPWLERAHAFKDKTNKGIEATMGLFNYPILMAADILIMNSDIIPVGKDQEQHVEMAREIARRFNHVHGEVFIEPESLIPKEVAVVPGTDGQKMSKSYGNTVPMFATDAEIKKAVMSIVTGSEGLGESLNSATCNVFALHKLFSDESEMNELAGKYESGSIGYGDSKKQLLEKVITYVSPMRTKREELENNMDYVMDLLKRGGEAAREKAARTMKEVREKTGMITTY